MKIKELILELLVEDMTKSLKFYQDILGFESEIVFPEKNPVFIQVKKDNNRIMLYDRNDFQKEIPKLKRIKMGGSMLLYMKVEKVEEFYQQIKNKAKIIQPLHKTNYSSLEFTIEDRNGYFLAFSERE